MRLFLVVGGIAVLGWMHLSPPEPVGSPARPVSTAGTAQVLRDAAASAPAAPIAAARSEAAPQPVAVAKAEPAPAAASVPTPVIEPSDAEIARRIVAREAVWASGNCRCPDDTDRRGRRCGTRSVYSRAGADKPVCYEKDVSAAMIEAYRDYQLAASR